MSIWTIHKTPQPHRIMHAYLPLCLSLSWSHIWFILSLRYIMSLISHISDLWFMISLIYQILPMNHSIKLGNTPLLITDLIILTYKIFSVDICQIFLQRSSSNLQHLSPYDHQHTSPSPAANPQPNLTRNFIKRWHSTSLLLLHFVHDNPLWANMF